MNSKASEKMEPYFTYSLSNIGVTDRSLIVKENETDYWIFISRINEIKSKPNLYREAHMEASFHRVCEWMDTNHPELLL
jgi:hypothetical protein